MDSKTGLEGDERRLRAGEDVETPPAAERDPVSSRNTKARPRGKGLRLPRRFQKAKPGSAPGIEPHELASLPSTPGAARITCIDYCPAEVNFEEVKDLSQFIIRHRPAWSAVRWINIDGLADLDAIGAFAEKYGLHPLAIEDVLHVPQRPKVEAYETEGPYQARLFIVARMMELVDGHIHSEQISIFVGHNTVLTFQETAGDVWDPVRARLRATGSQLRRADASFLGYTLIDAMVDHVFPILEQFGDRLEQLEDEVLQNPGYTTIQEIHGIKRELLLVRRAMWPMREVLQRLHREPHECLSEMTRTYVRDVYEHAVQVIDIVETYRELAVGLTETHMTAMSNRMNEIVKVLTIIGTIFIPLTFLAGVYGMNFRHLPELEWQWGYAIFWMVSAMIAGGMIVWFRVRGWI